MMPESSRDNRIDRATQSHVASVNGVLLCKCRGIQRNAQQGSRCLNAVILVFAEQSHNGFREDVPTHLYTRVRKYFTPRHGEGGVAHGRKPFEVFRQGIFSGITI